MEEFKDVVEKAQELLSNHAEWRERYKCYANEIIVNIERIMDKKRKFHQWAPLYLYMNISNAKGAASTFNLRYLGQAVANLNINKNGAVTLKDTRFRENNNRDFGCEAYISDKGERWDGNKAIKFRRHFSKYPYRAKGADNKLNEEHRVESMLLTEFSKRIGKDKNILFHNIQPVKIADIARFQMPTPFKASEGEVEYTGKGGGIDILARIGKGKGTKLCIMEVKDEYLEQEPPKAAIKQGLVYATFIRELLRSECGNNWWKIFGFSKDVPKKLVLYIACVMPFNESAKETDKSFSGCRLNIGEDVFELHYVYFKEENRKVKYAETSLRKEK